MNRYNGKTSGMAYTLSAVLPLIFQLVILLVVNVLLASFGSSNREAVMENRYFVWMLLFVNQLSFLMIIYWITKRNKVNFAMETGLKKPLDFEYLGLGLAATVALLFAFSPVVSYFIEGLTRIGYVPATNSVPPIDGWGSFLMSVFVLAMLPAVAEECLFRGIVLTGMKNYGKLFAVMTTAIFFMLMHQSIEQTIYQLALGLLLCYVAVKTGSVKIPVMMHFASNFIVLLMEFIANMTGRASGGTAAWEWIAMGIGFAALAVIVVYEFIVKKRRESSDPASKVSRGEISAAVAEAPAFPKKVLFAYAGFGLVFNVLMFLLNLFHVMG